MTLQCNRCQFFSHDPHLVCALHPGGPDTRGCKDFEEAPGLEPEEMWLPEGMAWYAGSLSIPGRLI